MDMKQFLGTTTSRLSDGDYNLMMLKEHPQALPLFRLARICKADWVGKDGQSKVWFGAEPYLKAMLTLGDIQDTYGYDSGREIVLYFLANSAQWRGEVARLVKAELKRRLKEG